jgi:hypothetical protein
VKTVEGASGEVPEGELTVKQRRRAINIKVKKQRDSKQLLFKLKCV